MANENDHVAEQKVNDGKVEGASGTVDGAQVFLDLEFGEISRYEVD